MFNSKRIHKNNLGNTGLINNALNLETVRVKNRKCDLSCFSVVIVLRLLTTTNRNIAYK